MGIYEFLEFRHLVSIVGIAEYGTFTAAAPHLNIVQSALSRQIRELEDQPRIHIFEPGSATLTASGESLLVYARRALAEREEVVNAAVAIHQAALQPFRLGFSPFVDKCVLATATRAYRELFPKGDISPETGDTSELVQRLKEGTLDAALVTLPLSPDGYQLRQIMHEPLVVCIRKDDPLAAYEEIPPTALNDRLAIFSDPRHHALAHQQLMEMLDEQSIKPRMSNPTFNSEHVQWMVREKLCLALITKHETFHDELISKPIQGVEWTIDSAVIYLAESKQFTAPNRELGVANRDLGTIERIGQDGQLAVRMDNGKGVMFDPDEMRHFDHGYAVTSHSSQGLTADRVLVNIDTIPTRPHQPTLRLCLGIARGAGRANLYQCRLIPLHQSQPCRHQDIRPGAGIGPWRLGCLAFSHTVGVHLCVHKEALCLRSKSAFVSSGSRLPTSSNPIRL
jgi:LysR family hydrogen peroxide-inducible transcriptional activator